ELFINNGDLTFTERAKEYGVADKGFSTHAVFFDYDRDGDLDLYILNNSYQAIGSFNLMKNERPKRDSLGGDKLMRNDGNRFVDVSEEAGIYGSIIGFGLGATVGDINKDGWPDIYVSNDFFERDYLYLNKKDGTFKECLTDFMKSISGASMGADMADVNNDGLPDLFVTEMLPQSNDRIKTVTTFENWDRYQYNVRNDYYHQFTRNTLQINQGDARFSELSRLAKVEATDWSWGALIFDMDNDGLKDIFVANGIYQDLTNQDYLQYISNEEVVKSIISDKGVDYKKLVDLIPSNPVANYAFKNTGNLTFKNVAQEWGLGEPNFSNGSAYGDLDNDGDLDLVVNQVNSTASVYRNKSNELNPHARYLKFSLKGTKSNTLAIGTRIEITKGDNQFYIEQSPNRGFESSVDPRPNVGLGAIDTVDVIKLFWPDGKLTTLNNVATNQLLELDQALSKEVFLAGEKDTHQHIFEAIAPVFEWSHTENDFVDFDRDKLTYHMMSTEGPRISVADVNGDGLDDLFVGGAKDSPGHLFVQTPAGSFESQQQDIWWNDKGSEDLATLFFDADNDGDLDLYVCSGGNEFAKISNALADRLYLNQGNGVFIKSPQALPTSVFENSSVVKFADYDLDGDRDLFVGIRSEAFAYGLPVNGYILQNNGKGKFENVTSEVAPGLTKIGMITDATWADIDNDGDLDLLVIGEYMSVNVFVNDKGIFSRRELSNLKGWWKRIEMADVDADGDIDFVVTNYGLNSRFRATPEKPVTMVVNDFDKNGTIEQILCAYNGEKSYPFVLRHDLTAQIPSLKKKYLKYENFKNETITDIFSKSELKDAVYLEAQEFRSGLLINDGNGNFEFKPLPMEAQYSPMYAIAIGDYDGDGNLDILLGGNLYRVKPEIGRYDASYGAFLKGDGKGNYHAVYNRLTGLILEGEIRDFARIKVKDSDVLIALRNNDSPLFFKLNSKK
ncbi:MAG: VCBS repeat-containing protein, partial [Cyclobacteriaceae bacterium]|nr:VCBS repeat-containing protein [Cyclobacteriaceae bacterium]